MQELEAADVILLLVSSDFLASDYCYGIEMEAALRKRRMGEAIVIPVILRPCDWKRSPLGEIVAAPRDGKPVTTWTNQDEAFLDVVNIVRNAIEAQTPLSSVPQGNPLPHSPGLGPIPIHLAMNWSPSSMVLARVNRMLLGSMPRPRSSVALIAPDTNFIGPSFVVAAIATGGDGSGLANHPVAFVVRGGKFGTLDLSRTVLDGDLIATETSQEGLAMAKIYPDEAEVWVGAEAEGFQIVWSRVLCVPVPEDE